MSWSEPVFGVQLCMHWRGGRELGRQVEIFGFEVESLGSRVKGLG